VGIERVCTFRSSLGVSISRFNTATFINAGVEYKTTTKAVKKTRMSVTI
jgi:hypothetical protein